MYHLKETLNISSHLIDYLENGYSDNLLEHEINQLNTWLQDNNLIYVSCNTEKYDEFGYCECTKVHGYVYECTFIYKQPTHLAKLVHIDLHGVSIHAKINAKNYFVKYGYLLKS